MTSPESVNVMVGVRVRPLSSKEQKEVQKDSSQISVFTHGNTVEVETCRPGDATESSQKTKSFTFDKVYNSIDPRDREYATQDDIFQTMGLPAVNHAFKGYNTCIFAYGQTGAGKTYTMMGLDDPEIAESERTGLIPRVGHEIFERIHLMQSATKSFRIHISYYELYNERPSCLIAPDPDIYYRVREHPVTGPYVENITVRDVHSVEEILLILRQSMKFRHTASTKMNDVSSRSHAVCTLTLTCSTFIDGDVSETCSRMNLVDLAGSERSLTSGTSGLRLQEGSNINKSLLTLGNVIEALAKSSEGSTKAVERFIPYRDSSLTWLLKEALGGNSRTHMLAMISPSVLYQEETVATLKYADRAKKITNVAVVNTDSKRRVVSDLRQEIATLRAELQKYKDLNKIELALDGDVLRLHREEPYILQLQPAATVHEPLMYFFNEGTTEITCEANRTLPEGVKYTIQLNKRFEVLPQHCAFERRGNQVSVRNLSTTGVLTVDEEDIAIASKLSLRSGMLLGIGEYVFQFINPLEQSEVVLNSPLRPARNPKRNEANLFEAISGLIGDTTVPDMETLDMYGESGDSIIVRDSHGTLTLCKWDTREQRWCPVTGRPVQAEEVDVALQSLVARDKADIQLSQRIRSILGDLAKDIALPEAVPKEAGLPTDGAPVLVLDAATDRYSVMEWREGLWRKAEASRAELAALSFAEKLRQERHRNQSAHALRELTEKSTTLAQAKENLRNQLQDQEVQLSERRSHLQNMQLAGQHVKQRLQRKEAMLQKDIIEWEKELNELITSHNKQTQEVDSKLADLRERNRVLSEQVESKGIELNAKIQLWSMVDESKETASRNVLAAKQQKEALVKKYHEQLASIASLKRTRDDLMDNVRKETLEVLALRERVKSATEIPEDSYRAQMIQLQEDYDALMLNHKRANENLENLSAQYTTYMTRGREYESMLAELTEHAAVAQAHYCHVQETMQVMRGRCAALEKDITKTGMELSTLDAENRRMKEKMTATVEAARTKERELFKTRMEGKGEEIKDALAARKSQYALETKALQAERAKLRASAQQLEEKLQADVSRMTFLEDNIQKKELRIAKDKGTLAQLKKDTDHYMRESSSRKMTEMEASDLVRQDREQQSKLSSLEQTLRDKRQANEKNVATIAEAKEFIVGLQQEKESISEQLKKMENEVKSAKQERDDMKKQLALLKMQSLDATRRQNVTVSQPEPEPSPPPVSGGGPTPPGRRSGSGSAGRSVEEAMVRQRHSLPVGFLRPSSLEAAFLEEDKPKRKK